VDPLLDGKKVRKMGGETILPLLCVLLPCYIAADRKWAGLGVRVECGAFCDPPKRMSQVRDDIHFRLRNSDHPCGNGGETMLDLRKALQLRSNKLLTLLNTLLY
jgi:hypothetical protein